MILKKTVIGITGPIASGKNEAARILKSLGANIIDADKIGHAVLKRQKKKIVSQFGAGILLDDGSISRKKLALIVFSNKKLLEKLNSLMHPEILKNINDKIASSRNKTIVVNAAVLKEIGLMKIIDFVVLIIADNGLRIKRLMNKGLSEENAIARIKSQMPDKEYKKIADFVIYNNGSVNELKSKVLNLYKQIKREIKTDILSFSR